MKIKKEDEAHLLLESHVGVPSAACGVCSHDTLLESVPSRCGRWQLHFSRIHGVPPVEMGFWCLLVSPFRVDRRVEKGFSKLKARLGDLRGSVGSPGFSGTPVLRRNESSVP